MSIEKNTEQKFTAIDLLNVICDGLFKYRVPNSSTKMSVSINMPNETFEKFLSDMKIVYDKVDVTDILYAEFKFCFTKSD